MTDDVYRRLRREIMVGSLRPHQALGEVELANRLGVSRTPIRESMQRLRADGLVISERRRWIVYAHTRAEMQDIFEVRMALEGYAARLSCDRAADAEVDALQSTLGELTAPDVGVSEFVLLNAKFHAIIVDSCGNQELQAQVGRHLTYGFIGRLSSTYSTADIRAGNEEHHQIAHSIARRDADTAEALARAHVQSALRLALERGIAG